MSAMPLEQGEITTKVTFTHPTNYVRIQAEQTEAGQKTASVNGIILQNAHPGVLYHSVGINGAHFSDYNNSPLFFSQIQILQPDLIIISLGTNEGANIKITEEEMIASVTTMLKNIKSFSPSSLILITTPADDYFRKKYQNPYLETVHRSLVKIAETEKVACWDLYDISGGFGSCIEWRNAGMLQRDGVHYNKQGYILQGSLFYKALIDSYFRYAAD
jgi:lysophospholipase L1-like esterase